MLITAFVVGASYVVYHRYGYARESFRMTRVKSLMGAVELQVRSRALLPEAYKNCGGGTASCQVNDLFFSDLRQWPVSGAICPSGVPKCGIQTANLSYDAPTNSFRAELKYQGLEVKPKPVEISVPVPVEILQADVFHCGLMNPDTPVFTGFDANTGAPVCRGFNTCDLGKFVDYVNVSARKVGCKSLPPAVSCPSQTMISSLSWQGDSLDAGCSGLPDPPFTSATTYAGDWEVGPWSDCVNTSCSGGTQTRTVTCPSGSCTGPEPPSKQSCIKGKPCVWDLTALVVMNNCQPYSKTDNGIVVDGLPVASGARCLNAGATNQDGFWAPPIPHPPCDEGMSLEQHLLHTCQGVCPSGNWDPQWREYPSDAIYGPQKYQGVYEGKCKP